MSERGSEEKGKDIILAVDDVPQNLLVLGNLLKEENFRMSFASNGEQALKMVSRTIPDLILLDVMMPGMDGFEVCRQLKSTPETKEIPVIFLTGRSESDDIIQGFEIGGVDYVTKPVNGAELLVRIKTHLELKHAREKLVELDKMKSHFFANISHEFRTPLTLIMGLLNQQLSGCGDKEQKEEIHIMLRSSRRLLNLINQLLDLAKLESGKLNIKVLKRNIIPFLKGLAGTFESAVIQKKLELTFSAEKEDILLYFDREKLEKAVSNLLTNALKFTPAGGKVSVSASKHPEKKGNFPSGYVKIEVRDTGIGIPENQIPFIYDRFFQVNGSSPQGHRHQGTGIGLAIAKELVELHHGEIGVISSEGKGTVFTIRLPLGKENFAADEIVMEEPPPPHVEIKNSFDPGEHIDIEEEKTEYPHDPGTPAVEMASDTTEKEVILIVEDNADVRQYIRGPLQKEYTVVEAADGTEGIAKAKEMIPDLIISDIMMPGVDGCALCAALKKDVKTSHIPIIFLTAKASEENIIEGLETGADDYITKPFNVNILLIRIKNLIDLRRHLQEKIQREMLLQPTEIAVSSVDREFMKELKDAIEKNMSDEEFGVDELAKALIMGRSTLNRKIKALTGESTNQFIQSYRLKRAAQLLKSNFGSVLEVAVEVGFSSSSYFTKCFKNKFHQLPHALQEAGEEE